MIKVQFTLGEQTGELLIPPESVRELHALWGSLSDEAAVRLALRQHYQPEEAAQVTLRVAEQLGPEVLARVQSELAAALAGLRRGEPVRSSPLPSPAQVREELGLNASEPIPSA